MIISMQTSPFAVLGTWFASSDATLVIRESNTPSAATRDPPHHIGKLAPLVKHLTYPRADYVVAVSADAADDIARTLDIPREKVTHIYNPTYTDTIIERSEESVDHTWFEDNIPVVISVGRFSDQKDFETLIRAIAKIQEIQSVRLLLVGDGENRVQLERLADDLGIASHVDFVGYQPNPYKYMSRADLFVLSSHYEGLPNVLIEAVGVRTPAIATDCPSGPREILLDGKGGDLVEVGDVDALSQAILEAIEDPESATEKLERAREKLDRFTPERAAQRYLDLLG